MQKTLPLFVATIAAFCNIASGAIIFSDDFQSETTPPIPPSYIENYTDFAKWDVVGSGVDLVGPGGSFPPRISSIMVDLDGTSGSTLVTKQLFNLQPGIYHLSFDLGGPVGGTMLDTVVVSLGSVFSESINVLKDDPFITFSRSITVASATTGRLSFSDLGADSNGAFVDNVQLSAVPEPTAFMIWSSLLGLAAFTRRQSVARAVK